jgi:excisionase family DNA binding protein
MNGKLLKSSDVAEHLGISKSLAYRLMQSGELESIRFGRTCRVTPEALEKFIQDCKVSSQSKKWDLPQ